MLGEFGAAAIRRALVDRGVTPLPTIRTIGRILERRGALDGRRRVRRPAPPPGWYLPDVADRRAELDSFDIVEGLVIKGGTSVEVLDGIALHGGLTASWPMGVVTAKAAVEAILEHWRAVGLPGYAQFDNDTIFQGPHQHKDVIGRVMRACLGLGVVPVFAPPREMGFQASIEAYNGRWQPKVWARFWDPTWTTCRCARRRSWRLPSALGAASRRLPNGWRSRATGRSISVRRRLAGWSSCGAPATSAACRSSACAIRWTRTGCTGCPRRTRPRRPAPHLLRPAPT